MMPITFTIKKDQWLSFEAEMITKTQLAHLIPFKWEALSQTETVIVCYDSPADTYSLKQLLESNQFTTELFNALCKTLIALNQTLQSYMLASQYICHHPESILYSPQLGKFYFHYMLDSAYNQAFSVLDLVRHVAIEMNQNHLFEYLKIQHFDLECFQSKILIHKLSFWQKLKKPTKHIDAVNNRTPQKHVYPMLLDRYNPTLNHILYFDQNTIGRDEQSNIYLDDLSISRNHAILTKSGQQFIYKDLRSTNGSKVNGINCHVELPVVNGDIIQIGEKEFIFIR